LKYHCSKVNDKSGNPIGAYQFDTFGIEVNPDPNDTNPFRYSGEYLDLETNTYYLRARYYQPTTGRFLSEDPIRAGLNWYIYGLNNPITRVDPTGLDSYILYDPNDNGFASYEKAQIMAKELKTMYGTPCHIIPISSGQDLIDRWNGVDNYGLGFDNKGKAVTSIYGTFGTAVSENDIRLVLRAWSVGQWQRWGR